jgi:integrase
MPAIPFDRLTAELDVIYRTRAPASRTKMRQVLREFRGLDGISTTADLTPPNVARFASAHPGRNRNTVRGLLSYLRAAANHAVACGYLERSPFLSKLVRVKPQKPTRKQHHEVEAIARVFRFLEIGSKGSWEGHRLYALFATVAFTGVRRDEALYLHRGDLHLDEGWIELTPHGKPYKTDDSSQPVPCPDALCVILAGWLPEAERGPRGGRRRKMPGHPWLFPGAYCTGPWIGGPAGRKPLDCLKAAGRAAGVEGLSFQSLRHSWATHAESRWGLGDALIQRVLRHTTPLTQRAYRHPDLANLRAAVAGLDFGTGAA